jgi:hypothetical protein
VYCSEVCFDVPMESTASVSFTTKDMEAGPGGIVHVILEFSQADGSFGGFRVLV